MCGHVSSASSCGPGHLMDRMAHGQSHDALSIHRIRNVQLAELLLSYIKTDAMCVPTLRCGVNIQRTVRVEWNSI
jgi:hypothetical protein